MKPEQLVIVYRYPAISLSHVLVCEKYIIICRHVLTHAMDQMHDFPFPLLTFEMTFH